MTIERVWLGQALRRARRRAKWAVRTEEELLRAGIDESAKLFNPVLRACLGTAVPMWIDKMRHWRADYRVQVAHGLVEITCHHQGMAAIADPADRGTVKEGGVTVAFNAVAQGLACLAFCPGGVVFAGHHWQVAAATPTEAPTPTPTQRTESTP
jgi:hypothetical protein